MFAMVLDSEDCPAELSLAKGGLEDAVKAKGALLSPLHMPTIVVWVIGPRKGVLLEGSMCFLLPRYEEMNNCDKSRLD